MRPVRDGHERSVAAMKLWRDPSLTITGKKLFLVVHYLSTVSLI